MLSRWRECGDMKASYSLTQRRSGSRHGLANGRRLPVGKAPPTGAKSKRTFPSLLGEERVGSGSSNGTQMSLSSTEYRNTRAAFGNGHIGEAGHSQSIGQHYGALRLAVDQAYLPRRLGQGTETCQ